MLKTYTTTYRQILNWSLATSATFCMIASLPSKAMAIIGFQNAYNPSNWTLTNTNANGTVDTTNAVSGGQIDLTGGDNGSFSSGTTDWTITITPSSAGLVSFDWSYASLDLLNNDTAGYLLNSTFYTLATQDGDASLGPQSLTLNSGDSFGFRVQTIDNLSGPGIFTVTNFDVQPLPVPFESSPVAPLTILPILGFMGFYWQRQKRKLASSEQLVAPFVKIKDAKITK